MKTVVGVLVVAIIIGALLITPWAVGAKGTLAWRAAGWGLIFTFGSLAAVLVCVCVAAVRELS